MSRAEKDINKVKTLTCLSSSRTCRVSSILFLLTCLMATRFPCERHQKPIQSILTLHCSFLFYKTLSDAKETSKGLNKEAFLALCADLARKCATQCRIFDIFIKEMKDKKRQQHRNCVACSCFFVYSLRNYFSLLQKTQQHHWLGGGLRFQSGAAGEPPPVCESVCVCTAVVSELQRCAVCKCFSCTCTCAVCTCSFQRLQLPLLVTVGESPGGFVQKSRSPNRSFVGQLFSFLSNLVDLVFNFSLTATQSVSR